MTDPRTPEGLAAIAAAAGVRGPWERATGGLNVVWLGPELAIKAYLPHDADEATYERDALAAVTGRVPAPVPEIVASGTLGAWPWVVTRRLRGAPAMAVWKTLSTAARARFAHQVGEWLAALHALPCPASVAARHPEVVAWLREAWPTTRERHVAEGVSAALLDAAPELTRELPVRDLVFAHADLHDENVLIDDHGDLCGVLDFGDCARVPVAFELVPPVITLGRGEAAVIDALCAGLGRPVNRRDLVPYALLHPWGDVATLGANSVDALQQRLGA